MRDRQFDTPNLENSSSVRFTSNCDPHGKLNETIVVIHRRRPEVLIRISMRLYVLQ